MRLRLFLKGDCCTLRTICRLGCRSNREGGDLAAVSRSVLGITGTKEFGISPEAEKVFYFLLACVVSNVFDLDILMSVARGFKRGAN